MAALYEDALVYESGSGMTSTGALTAYSGAKTGRSPSDKRIVRESTSEKDVWWGPVNKEMSESVSILFSLSIHSRGLLSSLYNNDVQLSLLSLSSRKKSPELRSTARHSSPQTTVEDGNRLLGLHSTHGRMTQTAPQPRTAEAEF